MLFFFYRFRNLPIAGLYLPDYIIQNNVKFFYQTFNFILLIILLIILLYILYYVLKMHNHNHLIMNNI